jgi:alkylhydroperoxidase family enzyme
VLDGKGQVSDENVQAVRKAGFSDGEVAEIIAHVAINVFTNYFNIATQVDIDFPKVSSAKAA